MSTPTNHWKLGLFVVVGICACVATVIFFGGRSLKKETVAYKTYFDESVQGLELGSPGNGDAEGVDDVAQSHQLGEAGRSVVVGFGALDGPFGRPMRWPGPVRGGRIGS